MNASDSVSDALTLAPEFIPRFSMIDRVPRSVLARGRTESRHSIVWSRFLVAGYAEHHMIATLCSRTKLTVPHLIP